MIKQDSYKKQNFHFRHFSALVFNRKTGKTVLFLPKF